MNLHTIKQALSVPDRRALGALGEMAAWWMLEHVGYAVRKAERKHGDLRAIHPITGEIRQIEVKAARLSCDRKYRFTLYKKGCTDYRYADTVVLLAVLKSGDFVPFVIPVPALGERSQICIYGYPWQYGGKWSVYRQHERKLHL